jgi:hypothetical protein
VNLGGSMLGAALVILSAGMLLIFLRPNKKRAPVKLREIPAFNNLRQILGAAMEQGTRIHLGLGRAAVGNPNYGSTLAGLNTLESITRSTLFADQTPVVTSGDGTTSLLGQDVIKAVYRKESTIDRVPQDGSQLVGVTPFAYAVGSIPVISSPEVSANILIGHFGVESGLLTTASQTDSIQTLGATDSLPAQSVFFNASEDTLLGEETFALPAYLDQKPSMLASLMVQDLLRLVLVFGMLVGVVLVIMGVI